MTAAVSCLECPAGSSQIAGGQDACVPCPPNQFSASGSSACLSCENEFGDGVGAPPGSASCEICQPDYFLRTDNSACEVCAVGGGYEGFDCTAGGTTTETTPLKPGFWRPGLSYPRLLKCPDRYGWCIGGTDGDVCAEGE